MTREKILRAASTFVALGAASAAGAATDRIGNDYYGHMWSGGWGVMGAGSMILFWVLIIVVVVVAVKWLSQQNQTSVEDSGSALRTLEERLAKGEIDVAEFEERKKALSS